MMDKTSKSTFDSPLKVPLFLLVVCLLAYGLLFPSLGLYWDDLPYTLIYYRFGPGGYPDFVASDRPYSAWVFMGITWLLGEQPLGYHIIGLLMHWLCALLFWQLIRLLWPHHQNEALWAALLFAIYPGFLGHPQTVTYSHHFSGMTLYLFSLIATVQAVKAVGKGDPWYRSWLWHLPSVLATSLSQFTIEYFLGWEAVRLVAVWWIISRQTTNRKLQLRSSLLHLAPYWLISLWFLVWRVFIFRFPTYQPIDEGVLSFVSLAWWQDILSQVMDAVFLVWKNALPHLTSQDFSQPFWLLYLLLTLLSTSVVFLCLHYACQQPEQDTPVGQNFGLPALLMALAGIAFAGWPFWLVDLELSIEGHFRSRFTLAFIPWVALLVTALLHLLSRIKWQSLRVLRTGLIALLVGGSIGSHFWNANFYRNQWVEVQRYFQQLNHRAPGLEKDTVLVVNDMPSIQLYQDDSLTALLNWIYAPENKTKDLDYAIFYLSVRLGSSLPALDPGIPINKDYRSLRLSSSTDRLLVVHYDPPGCLRVIDPLQPDRIPLTLPEAMSAAVPLSNLGLIKTDQTPAASPPEYLFDFAETETWCLYFQDAELAAQRGEWQRVAEIGDQAFAREDRPNELTEYFVFIEGYLRTGQLSQAFTISELLSERTDGAFNVRICKLWRVVQADDPYHFDQNMEFQSMIGQFCSTD
jgi:hypothetical protein